MPLFFFFLLLGWLPGAVMPAAETAPAWQTAEPGHAYLFPRDHGVHPDFKTEWWYFTGNLRAADGREFGFQLTWFRQGVSPTRDPAASRFVVRDFKFAHFTVTDVSTGHFYFTQKISRGAFGEAGFGNGAPGRLAWIDDWDLDVLPDGDWQITGNGDGRTLELRLTPAKPPTIQGENGVSQKASGSGHASYYYSLTRMRARGQLTLPGAPPRAVTGETWFDHEWATNQLAPNQAGWNWFSLQLADGSEIMLYQMRLRDGAPDAASSGTCTRPDGSSLHLASADFQLTPLEWWSSAATKARYPVRWELQIPGQNLRLEISTPVKDQELAFPAFAYWEGLIHAKGSRAGVQVEAHGYMELTGYSAALTALGATAVKP